ncbi:beta-1,3-glucanase family protein [Krasilnikovia sp. MM14-A1259]|uniref:beta-1,3-glucanase family protein n=1 Tax=Krasilnikovia sp. MM14-A1259 TaxID=3373539 RepID=UPI00380DD468
MRRKRTLILSVAAAVAAAGTAWIALPASAAAPTATLRTVAEWGNGWQAEVTVDNTGAKKMTSWKVEFDLPKGATIGSFWEAGLKASGSHRTFTSRPWNATVAVDHKVTFGFIGSGGLPTNCRLNGLPCSGTGSTPATSAATSAPVTPVTTKPTVQPTVTTATPQGDPPSSPASTPSSGDNTPPPPAGNLLPLKVNNKTGRGDDTFLYVLGTDLKSGKLGYVNAGGTFTAWPGAGAEPEPAPDVSIPGPKDGASTTIKVPKGLSGRLYFSFGKKLDFKLTSGGLVQPAPWAGGDPNRNILFDWSEFTLDNGGLFLNSSQVDMFAVPHIVSVQGGNGAVTKTGELKADGRDKVIDAVKSDPDFAKSVVKGADGTVLRVLAPGKAADAGLMDPKYLDQAIDQAWNAYTTRTLTVAPFGDRPDTKFFGRTSGNVLNFTDGTGRVVASFPKPSTANVWGCDGALGAPNDQVVGPIARTLCAALTRGTLGTLDNQPSGAAKDFYRGEDPNTYAKVIHQNMIDGKAYAFAFDDVQNQESLVHDGDPRTATITMTPF